MGKWEAGKTLVTFILRYALWQHFSQNCSGPYQFYGTLLTLKIKKVNPEEYDLHFPTYVLWTMNAELILSAYLEEEVVCSNKKFLYFLHKWTLFTISMNVSNFNFLQFQFSKCLLMTLYVSDTIAGSGDRMP